ncbi:AMP-binding enzyme [Nocardia carnea]|uniref:AMP-binding enzyme n=1 Tax=Nocardia carnea TaxID=37328 RepID=UPI002453913B|nr:hypothetical protein [Nocardia carnea]
MQPTILRMLLDADVAPEDLSSLEYLPGGSGPLDPELRGVRTPIRRCPAMGLRGNRVRGFGVRYVPRVRRRQGGQCGPAAAGCRGAHADGFVTVYGRADGAINRGGSKILPGSVRAVLLRHPAVRDACVVGVRGRRLGQVPFAAVELRPERGVPAAVAALCPES